MNQLSTLFVMPSSFRWLFFCLFFFPCTLGHLMGQEASQIQVPSIRVEVNLVTLRFTVKNRQGSLLNNLKKEDFRVFEDGVPHEIVFFNPPRNTTVEMGPLRLAFLLDISGSTFETRAQEITAATTFLENVHDFTKVGVFGFTDKLILFQDFTSIRSLAHKALTEAHKHLGRTAIYGSLNTLISQINSRSGEAVGNVIIVISDGMDDAYKRSAQTLALARASNVVIYTILVPSAAQLYIAPSPALRQSAASSASAKDDREAQEKAFANLSIRTGGKHFSGFEAILDFDEVMAQINDDIFGNLYSIGYYTDDPYRDKRERNIRVQIQYPDAFIPARFENLPERLTAKKKFIAALFDNEAIARLPENLHSTFHEIGAEMDLLTPKRQGGQLGLPFRIKISPYSLRATDKGGIRTQFGIIGLLLDQDGNEVVRLREIFRVRLDAKQIREGRGIIYTNKLFAPPGIYAFKVALLEIPTWKMTAFENVVRIEER
ncbi:VWA domain-containing protein [Acidobacteria bacterium AH-259-L09]|nr:VWA domain-containing protein [Acidobacteria bacterium AH-259-L09]